MNIGIIGLGLIGGSLGRTIIKRTEHKVYGYDLNTSVLDKAEVISALNFRLTKENAKDVDVLIISVYPRALDGVLKEFLPCLKQGAIVVDCCGVKRYTEEIMKNYVDKYKEITFIGGHPMAGREYSGIDHAITTLFDKAYMILSPINADIFALDKTKKFFLELGFCSVVITNADNHDKIIAFTSQLCHIVSNAFIKNKTAEDHMGFSAGSYRDLTRVAMLNPTMWTELMLDNKDKLVPELKELIGNLNGYLQALESGNYEELYTLLDDGNKRKISIDSRRK